MSSLMLDTCGLIWLVNDGGELTPKTLTKIQRADIVYISAMTALEIGYKVTIGKLELKTDATDWYHSALDVHDIVEIPLDGEIALRAACLPLHHRDPADRVIIATAMTRNLPVVTHDSRFSSYGIQVLA